MFLPGARANETFDREKNARPYLEASDYESLRNENGAEERKGAVGESSEVALRGDRRMRGDQSYERRWNL